MEGEAKAGLEAGGEMGTETKVVVPGIPAEDLAWLAQRILESRKRVVVEDFHYLTELERRRLAFDLKALWDAGVFFIIIGIWAEHDLLTFYNGDLSGRVEDVDLVWTDAELDQVLAKGEEALNIRFGADIRAEILRDASQNVGLLQRLAERFCFESKILATVSPQVELTDQAALARTRALICKAEKPRYKQFSDAVTGGFKGGENTELKVYEHVVRVCIESSDDELRQGIPKDALLKRIQKYEPKVRMSDLSAALNRLDRLQSERDVSPLVLTFSGGRVSLVDRELLFFRRYFDEPIWPWTDTEAGADQLGSPPEAKALPAPREAPTKKND
jgi:hypothetical protein